MISPFMLGQPSGLPTLDQPISILTEILMPSILVERAGKIPHRVVSVERRHADNVACAALLATYKR